MDRRLFGIVAVRAHPERPARDEDHVGERVLPLRIGSLGAPAFRTHVVASFWLEGKDRRNRRAPENLSGCSAVA